MIDGIELSKSNKSRCKFCGKIIGEKTPRLVVDLDKGQYTAHIYYCCECAEMQIDLEITNLKIRIDRMNDLKIKMRESISNNQKAIVLQKLERDKNE